MSRPAKREQPPRRLAPIKVWAVVTFDGKLAPDPEGEGLAVYPRRYMAAVVASQVPDSRVVPVAIRSLQHRPR